MNLTTKSGLLLSVFLIFTGCNQERKFDDPQNSQIEQPAMQTLSARVHSGVMSKRID